LCFTTKVPACPDWKTMPLCVNYYKNVAIIRLFKVWVQLFWKSTEKPEFMQRKERRQLMQHLVNPNVSCSFTSIYPSKLVDLICIVCGSYFTFCGPLNWGLFRSFIVWFTPHLSKSLSYRNLVETVSNRTALSIAKWCSYT